MLEDLPTDILRTILTFLRDQRTKSILSVRQTCKQLYYSSLPILSFRFTSFKHLAEDLRSNFFSFHRLHKLEIYCQDTASYGILSELVSLTSLTIFGGLAYTAIDFIPTSLRTLRSDDFEVSDPQIQNLFTRCCSLEGLQIGYDFSIPPIRRNDSQIEFLSSKSFTLGSSLHHGGQLKTLFVRNITGHSNIPSSLVELRLNYADNKTIALLPETLELLDIQYMDRLDVSTLPPRLRRLETNEVSCYNFDLAPESLVSMKCRWPNRYAELPHRVTELHVLHVVDPVMSNIHLSWCPRGVKSLTLTAVSSFRTRIMWDELPDEIQKLEIHSDSCYFSPIDKLLFSVKELSVYVPENIKAVNNNNNIKMIFRYVKETAPTPARTFFLNGVPF
eukprot:TRINITY_DN4416_c0_g1_i2.p1 TRINITY_DN4416_c0_g1~~TRINITY_DN4416_c0_g1_i2.p1  ORF type:complete len:389 (+),score=40.25 TRINITY_DN4416_c0_g1_i2:53-1219(+)